MSDTMQQLMNENARLGVEVEMLQRMLNGTYTWPPTDTEDFSTIVHQLEKASLMIQRGIDMRREYTTRLRVAMEQLPKQSDGTVKIAVQAGSSVMLITWMGTQQYDPSIDRYPLVEKHTNEVGE